MDEKRIKCFFLEPTIRAQVSLRRYASGSECPHKPGYHNASFAFDEVDYPLQDDKRGFVVSGSSKSPSAVEKEYGIWPEKCSCGYIFELDDVWQVNTERFYKTSEEPPRHFTIKEAPPGAMWHADWMSRRGPDGHCLVVRIPAGDWMIDGPSAGGGGWTRTGEPPNITVSPSIVMGERGKGFYHAFLRDGVLEACGDSEL